MKPQILYKINGSVETNQLLNIVRYLYTQGYDIRADVIIEREIPSSIVGNCPALVLSDGSLLQGLKQIIEYYSEKTKITHLFENSQLFDELNPDYRITLPYTHKNLRF